MINELHLLWVPNFIALGIYFLFGTKFSWKEETYTCFNVECVLLGWNFDFLGSYLVVIARYLMVAAGYCSLPSSYCSLLVVTARYRSLLLVLTFNMNGFCFTFYLGLPPNPTTRTVSAPESVSGSKGLPSFDTFSHNPRLFQQQYDTTEILNSGSQKEFYSTYNNSNTAPSRFAEISSTCEIRRSVIQEEISLKQNFCK